MGGREFDHDGRTDRSLVIDQPDIAARLWCSTSWRCRQPCRVAAPIRVPICWINADTASDAERYVAARASMAPMTETCLHLLGADGPVIVEGPFAGNLVYLEALANFTDDVEAVSGSTGTSLGADCSCRCNGSGETRQDFQTGQ